MCLSASNSYSYRMELPWDVWTAISDNWESIFDNFVGATAMMDLLKLAIPIKINQVEYKSNKEEYWP
jgi:hypothetical protein